MGKTSTAGCFSPVWHRYREGFCRRVWSSPHYVLVLTFWINNWAATSADPNGRVTFSRPGIDLRFTAYKGPVVVVVVVVVLAWTCPPSWTPPAQTHTPLLLLSCCRTSLSLRWRPWRRRWTPSSKLFHSRRRRTDLLPPHLSPSVSPLISTHPLSSLCWSPRRPLNMFDKYYLSSRDDITIKVINNPNSRLMTIINICSHYRTF